MAPTPQSSPSLKIRIDLDAEDRIGPGKIRLLEAIDTCGSISVAGRMMNMSYKHAWDLVDEIARSVSMTLSLAGWAATRVAARNLHPLALRLWSATEKSSVRYVERPTAIRRNVNPFTLVVRRSSYTPLANAGAVHEDWRRLLREPNLEKLNALVGKLVGDLGIALGGASMLLAIASGSTRRWRTGVKPTSRCDVAVPAPTETFGPSDTPIKWA